MKKDLRQSITGVIIWPMLIVFAIYALLNALDPNNTCKITPRSCSGKTYMQVKLIPYFMPFAILYAFNLMINDFKKALKLIARYRGALRYKKLRHQERAQRIAAGDLCASFPRKEKAIKEDVKSPKTPEEKRETLIFYSIFIAFVLAFITFLYFVLK
jgi:hypothetical protein